MNTVTLQRINHLAFPSFDAAATCRFYTEVMGFRLVSAFQGDSPEWGNRAFLHTSFALESGEMITFFDVDGMQRPPDDGLPKDIRHLALTIVSPAAIETWKERLATYGVSFWVEDHVGDLSLYFADPNGVLIELTAHTPRFDERDARAAAEVVRQWTRARGQRPAP